MHPFSITFHESDSLIFKIISIILALFVVGTWLYNSSHIKLILRIFGITISCFASYYVAIFFFGILQFSFMTIKDNFYSDILTATIIKYEKHISQSSSRTGRNIASQTRKNTFYTPLLKYKDSQGNIKNVYGDVSFSNNNLKSIGDKVEIVIENDRARMITPIKNFALVVNIVMLCFLVIFYYILYCYAKTQCLEDIGTFALTIFGFVIFPLAFGILIYLFLNIGYDYFFLGKRYTSRNMAIGISLLGIFLLLCLFGLIKSMFTKKRKKKKRKSGKKMKTISQL